MAVSGGKIREIRQTLQDIQTVLEHEDDFKDLSTQVDETLKTLDDVADDRGNVREDKGPRLGNRVKRDDDDRDSQGSDSDRKDREDPPKDDENDRRPSFGGQDRR
jgi:hypothetical protein